MMSLVGGQGDDRGNNTTVMKTYTGMQGLMTMTTGRKVNERAGTRKVEVVIETMTLSFRMMRMMMGTMERLMRKMIWTNWMRWLKSSGKKLGNEDAMDVESEEEDEAKVRKASRTRRQATYDDEDDEEE